MEWWMWLAAGLVLVVAELATPGGFVIIFFGIGALAVGVLALLGVVASVPLQFVLFSVLSVASLAFLRGRVQSRVRTPPSSNVDSLVGVVAMVQERMAPRAIGRVEVRGSMWAARNTSDVTLDPGQRALVAAVDGLTLAVVPE
ncbi:MAG TPA: NfeD family protein [Vicinamibacterales bacterium]|nr:NfeD family protein [Vicinamibacterales bacterium]